ncbi:hypothetical protein MYCTH_2301878 [Thermothelomyces thermophilus ATCC 42464]|uniref:Fungal lipase-type domain-containing protein n=1 Tax=Thermothelomyces thermophilus (strain ATCC 42464 / BCRC 31852 / DSM 1799) TaxID=573729 RepID=G2QAK1_THET4|nr:uncharacterized protein MYCTH_2301878 [Thermothelomyces thermophilus ATCC 42464]AEO56697.1 hypothetical protein MYCTH_2301878 [Thermothelomyces thermophilus ATCC 42464]
MGLFKWKKKVKKASTGGSQARDKWPPPETQYGSPPSCSSTKASVRADWRLGDPASGTSSQHAAKPPIIVNQHHYYFGTPPPSRPPAPTRVSSTPMSRLNVDSAVDLARDVCQETGQLLEHALPTWHSYGNQLVNQGNHLVEGISNRVYWETHQFLDGVLPSWHCSRGQLIQQSHAVVDEIANRFDSVLTKIDQGGYRGKEHDIYAWKPAQALAQPEPPSPPLADRNPPPPPKSKKKSQGKAHSKGQTSAAAGIVSGSFFSKVDCYANSRLPMNLPPLKLYIPTYPLLCLAAQYSERVYEPPRGRAERDTHVAADWRTGTKAMVIKSVPMDTMNTIVFAIRGTATFMDWAVNLDTTPTSPAGFLDDPDNLCHAGFLSVARKMVTPVARRLRQLLEEDPWRASYSLLITGHSAGGAVAALLYSHMLSESDAAKSELTAVAGFFKRIHCVTFGTPPISLMPLTKPDNYLRRPQLRKSIFLSFVNEGDPVARADKAYVKSLLELFAAPRPRVESVVATADDGNYTGDKKHRHAGDKRAAASSRSYRNRPCPTKPPPPPPSSSCPCPACSSKRTKRTKSTDPDPDPNPDPDPYPAGPVWKVPPCTLSCAGRIVVLRSGDAKARRHQRGGGPEATTVEERLREGVVAQVVTDEQLRGVVWGDPVAHMMRLYAGRIEVLAVGAVTGAGGY